ncbi:hypothetical protein AcV7_007790 [Taiwanofungus camphoratus]|nr:hypothetical protein AcV7_007790 [Antrodia cinnamomea]
MGATGAANNNKTLEHAKKHQDRLASDQECIKEKSIKAHQLVLKQVMPSYVVENKATFIIKCTHWCFTTADQDLFFQSVTPEGHSVNNREAGWFAEQAKEKGPYEDNLCY